MSPKEDDAETMPQTTSKAAATAPRRNKTIGELKAATPPESMIRYHAVSKRQQACLDLFSARLSALPEGKRFAAPTERGEVASDRVRNDMRTYALGCLAALGREVGLVLVELYGEGKGRTLLAELHPLHSATVTMAMSKFDAMCSDGSEIGTLVAERFRLLVCEAKAEVDTELAKLTAAGAQRSAA